MRMCKLTLVRFFLIDEMPAPLHGRAGLLKDYGCAASGHGQVNCTAELSGNRAHGNLLAACAVNDSQPQSQQHAQTVCGKIPPIATAASCQISLCQLNGSTHQYG